MAEQAIHEMISAYAVGCMDKQNFIQFKDYLAEGGDLPIGELGELQNVVSMIPVILDLEKPHDAIKDMVAKKLIGMKEEIKAKILQDRKTLVNTFTNGLTIADIPDASITRPFASTRIAPRLNTVDLKTIGTEPVSTFDASRDDFLSDFSDVDLFKNTQTKIAPIKTATISEQREVTKIIKEETKPINNPAPTMVAPPNPVVEEQKSSSSTWGILGIIITLLLCTILGYYTFITNQKLENKVEDLQGELNSMRSQLTTANSFVGSNSSLVEFLNYKDVNVVSLVSAVANEKAAAKILLSFNEKEGLIQFKSFPQLQPGQAFQLWTVSKGQSYPGGTYQPIGGEYLKISPFPFLPKEQIEQYKVTIESSSGATTPSSNVLLVSESPVGRRVR